MATLSGNDWELAPADVSTTALWTGRIKVTSIRWVGYNGIPDTAVLTDSAGRNIFNEKALATLEPLSTTYGEGKWIDGLVCKTLASGNVYVSIL